jgi:hypothetical protein
MKYQIIRMKARDGAMRQQHWDVAAGKWVFSPDRWAGTFEAAAAEAAGVFAGVAASCRKVRGSGLPKLHELVDGVSEAAAALGRQGAGKPKVLSEAEREKRRERLAAARAKRWEPREDAQ